MPVKVRCSGCQKVINAPERARGKAIKCPECETVVKVPAEKQVAKQAAAPPPSSSSIIANLDLRRLEDAENRICPNCGADVAPEDIECPKCEVMLETGQLSEKKKFQRARKGPNPALYYKNLPSDAWQFMMENKKLVLRTVLYSLLFSIVFVPGALMTLYVAKLPLKFFWGGIAFITFLVPPGWAWFLHILIINVGIENKRKMPKRILFDMFQCIAYGIKFFVWTLAMGAPLHAVALVCLLMDWPMVAAFFAGAGLLFALIAFPVAMVHMAMPVTRPAWEFWTIDAIAFRNALPVMYWLVFLFITMIPAAAVFTVGAVLYAEPLLELAATNAHNLEIQHAKDLEEEQAGAKLPVRLPDEIRNLAKQEIQELNWSVALAPAALWITATCLFGLTCIFNMRSNGLFAFVFRDRLNLISTVQEVKYVAKPVLDEEELEAQRRQLNGKKVALGLGLLAVLALAFGTAFSSVSDTKFLVAIAYGFFGAGSLAFLAGLGLLIYFAMKRPAGLILGGMVAAGGLAFLGIAAGIFFTR
ncbi:MAG: zinc ribbon domain-containing protein [Planctomycetaceae bacterium]